MKMAAIVSLVLALAAPGRAAAGPELGQTPDQVRSILGAPDLVSVAVEPGRNIEVWSYDKPYRFFWLECDQCAPPPPAGRSDEAQPLACRERARVVFLNGRVQAFLQRD